MYALFEAALDQADIGDRVRDPFVDRGDGVLALVHPVDHAPKTRLLDTVAPVLRTLLHDTRFQLRMVIHAGEVLYDRNGCFGEALDVAFRLLDAQPVRDVLYGGAESLALVVSDGIYRTVVCHGYDGINAAAYKPEVIVTVGGHDHLGWVQMAR